MLKKELHIFLTAVMFFTRIPCPKWTDHNPDYLRQSSKYFSLVGIIVGGFGALVFYGLQFIFSTEISLLISMTSTIFITAGFHEDGFADVCDGFGGGWTKEKILMIMKDSTLGTYGVIGLICILGLKFLALRELSNYEIPFLIICGHALSRFVATTLIYTQPYVRQENSKSKPAAKGITLTMVVYSAIFALIPALLFNPIILLGLIPMYLGKLYLEGKFKKWIGGQTGDCAGAVQQFTEVIFYLSIVALWKFI